MDLEFIGMFAQIWLLLGEKLRRLGGDEGDFRYVEPLIRHLWCHLLPKEKAAIRATQLQIRIFL